MRVTRGLAGGRHAQTALDPPLSFSSHRVCRVNVHIHGCDRRDDVDWVWDASLSAVVVDSVRVLSSAHLLARL
jgi:hypothetical protein